jgi:methionyl-tRNA synthetase
VEEQAPWQLAKEDSKAAELETTLRSLAEGIRTVTVLLHPYIPDTATNLLAALGEPELALASAGFGARRGGGTVSKLPQLFPKPQ